MRTFINILSALGVSSDALIFEETEGFEERKGVLNDFQGFLVNIETSEIKKLLEIIRLIARYKYDNINY